MFFKVHPRGRPPARECREEGREQTPREGGRTPSDKSRGGEGLTAVNPRSTVVRGSSVPGYRLLITGYFDA